MIFINYSGAINKKNTDELLASLNHAIRNVIELNSRMVVKIYYQSEGGGVTDSKIQLNALNSALAFCDVEIITGQTIMSAAIDVIAGFKGKVTISPDTIGMVHKTSVLLDQRDLLDSQSYANKVQKLVTTSNRKISSLYVRGLTAVQQRLFKEGKEVYLDSRELKKFIQDIGNSKKREVGSKVRNTTSRGTKGSQKVNTTK